MNRSIKRGFTLVEILIVVIILGILAAIVIPQFTNASQDARVSSLQSLTQTLRSQIELFKLQHGDVLPDIITNWTPFTGVTYYPSSNATFTGNIAGTSKAYGPYMQSQPTNPLTSLSTVVDVAAGLAAGTKAAVPAAAVGWVYDYQAAAGTGRIWGYHPTGGAGGVPALLD